MESEWHGTGSRSEAAARLAHGLARSHCGACRAYHSVWPYLRLTDPPRGVDADRQILLHTLAPLLFPGAHVLLAGSADAGIAELVLEAAAGKALKLTVMDLCATPLEQCRTLLAGHGSSAVTTRQGSITGQPGGAPADLVIAHSVLAFIPRPELAAAGRFLAGSLHPGGRLLLTTGFAEGRTQTDCEAFCDHVLADLAARGIALPEAEPDFRKLLAEYCGLRRQRINPFADMEELARWLHDCALQEEQMLPLRRGTAVMADGSLQPRATGGALVVARKPVAA